MPLVGSIVSVSDAQIVKMVRPVDNRVSCIGIVLAAGLLHVL